MIVQFSLKNVLSFKDKAVLDMTAIPAYKEHRYNLAEMGNGEALLKVAAIYGANASGKTNFYFGMEVFRRIVTRSLDVVGETEEHVLEHAYMPFAFEEKRTPSEFQIVVCNDRAELTYGFEYDRERIVSEWFYRKDFHTKRTSVILERDVDGIHLGSSVRRECDKYGEQIPCETLALTFFGRLKLKAQVFRELFVEIQKMLVIDTNAFENKRVIRTLLPSIIDKEKQGLLEFLAAIDVSIRDISYKMVDEQIVFFSTHRGKDGKDYLLNLFSESQGTIKSIVIYIFASTVIQQNGTLIVDELNVKLHPLLLKFIIDLFYQEDSKAQLIYTTHDTTLMDKKFFRRDQIWFVDKDVDGYSRLTALSDYKVRPDASFEKDYLAGVYGGIPMLREFSMKGADVGEDE